MKRVFITMQAIGITLVLIGGAAIDSENTAIPVCLIIVGGLVTYLFVKLENAFCYGEEWPMYMRLEDAGLISDTDEWKEVQEERMLQLIEGEGEADAGAEADIGQAL